MKTTFTAIDRTPFTYFLKHKITKFMYYGSKTSKGCRPEDLWSTYFTGSKIIHKIIADEGKEIFDIRIARVFNDNQLCRFHEVNFLSRVGAANNPMWYNQHNGNKKFLSSNVSGKISIVKNNKQKKIYPIELSHYESLGYNRGGLSQSEDAKKQQSDRFKNRIWVNNGLEQKRIDKTQLNSYMAKGYLRGRFPMDPITRQKISKSNAGKIVSDVARKRLSLALKGKEHGSMKAEIKVKISQTSKGKSKSAKHAQNIGLGHLGMKHTKDSKQKNSLAHRGKICINDGKINKYIVMEELNDYLQQGFIRGMIKNT